MITVIIININNTILGSINKTSLVESKNVKSLVSLSNKTFLKEGEGEALSYDRMI